MGISALLKTLVDRLNDEVILVHRDGSVVYENDAARTHLGLHTTVEEFVSALDDESVKLPDTPLSLGALVLQRIDEMFSGGSERVSFSYKNAGAQHFELTLEPIDESHIAALTKETTQLAEHEAKRYMVNRLASGLAHNFNNMLMIIEPCLEALDEVVPETHKGFVLDATEAGHRSSEIIRQLMTVAGQRYPGKKESLLFAQLCEQAVAQCQKSVQSLRLEFTAQSDSEVLGAPSALASVLSTLLKNASTLPDPLQVAEPLQLTDPLQLSDPLQNGIDTLSAQVQDIFYEGVPYVELLLQNNAYPLSESARGRIFEPFFHFGGERETGLELAMSEAIVREHGGRLTCHPVGNYGTAFSLILPAAQPTNSTTDNTMTSPANDGTRVLVIDDEPAICRIVAHTLKRNGFEVESISDPNQVEEAVQNGEFQVILLDRSMGGVKGSSLVPMLRAQAPGAKILYFTGEFVDSAEVAAVDGVVQKPVNSKQLTETLRAVL